MVMEVSKTPQESMIGSAVDVIIYLQRQGTSRIVEDILSVDGYDRTAQAYVTHSLKHPS